jgi:predicted lipid-binding transport protein (Tim44 family)
MGNPFDPMNIILLVFAVVAFIRLRATLGKRTGNEEPLDNRSVFQPKSSKNLKDADLNDEFIPQSKEEILDYMSSSDKNFSQEVFLDGSKNAYKMIVEDYASGNLESIESFISKEVYDGFSEAISLRDELQHKLQNEVVEFNSVEIIDAKLETNIIQLKVMFEAKMISYGEDSTGNVIEGNKDSPQVIKDIWIFQRPVKSRTPAWELISTNPDD